MPELIDRAMMPELIDRDTLRYDLCAYLCGAYEQCTEWCHTLKVINMQPTIEAEPVRHGHWIWLEPYGALFTHRRKCSECGDIKAQEESNFCPNCGARMDGGCGQ